MVALNETRVQSTPKVYVDGVLIPVVPNSVNMSPGGETSVRAMSAGGGSVAIVAGVNAEEMKGKVKFDLPNTAANVERARQWRDLSNKAIPVAVEVVSGDRDAGSSAGAAYAFSDMYLENNPEAEFAHEGNISLEFCGRHVP